MNKIIMASISLAMLLLAMFAFAPNSSQANEGDVRKSGGGQDISPLFEAPTAKEIAAVKADWAARDVRALDWQVLGEATIQGIRTLAVSHRVNGNAHYGFVRYPADYDATKSYPVLIFNHGGQNGIDVGALNQFAAGCLADFVMVVPSFRGEELRTGALNLGTLTSEGEKSEFDGDIDDLIALLNGTLENITGADASRIAAYGGSRGGAVTNIVSVRDARIRLGVSFFGATNHMHSTLQEPAQDMVDNGGPVPNPVVNTVMTSAVTPYIAGELTLAEARLALIRRSIYYFADDLPRPYQVHHGVLDELVPVLQGQILRDRMTELGIVEPDFTYFEYPEGGHGNNMPESFERMQTSVCTLGGAQEGGGQDISPLFEAPTAEELAAVKADWAARDVRALDWQVLGEATIEGMRTLAVSHRVNGNAHYGFVRYPADYDATKSYPVLIYSHGGQNGIAVGALNQFAAGCLADFVVVVPSFRGEALRTGQLNLGTLTSEGEISEFDGDIDDLIALLNGTLENITGADASRIAAYGGSRGGAVTNIVSVRDARIRLGVSFFGATNHMHSTLQETAQDIVDNGSKIENPVVRTVMTSAVTPYIEGELTLAEARLALIRRSIYYFADDLPRPYQVHHGARDLVVPVLQGQVLRDRMTELGIVEPDFTYFEYPNGGHGNNMPDSFERMQTSVCTLGGAQEATSTYQRYLPTVMRP